MHANSVAGQGIERLGHPIQRVRHYRMDTDCEGTFSVTAPAKGAFATAKVSAEIEVYSQSQHGWCVPDMPMQANGQPIYNKADADRTWGKLLALYKAGLA